MPVRIETDGERLEVVVRQGVGSLIAFAAMVVVIGLAASARGRAVSDPTWIWWPLGLGLAAAVWCVYALSAEERYWFNRGTATFDVSRRTFFGTRTAASGNLGDLFGARAAWVGYDNSVRGIEVIRRNASVLTLPLRTTGLTEGEQSRIATAIDGVVRAERVRLSV